MQLKNTQKNYGFIAISLHWLVALMVFGLFALGLWMVELGYYDDWYKTAPSIHKSIGVILFGIMLLRLVWRLINPRPEAEPGAPRIEQKLAQAAHLLLYILLFSVMIAGYLISTADGRPVEVFSLFAVPALLTDIPNMEDTAGKVHFFLAVSLMLLATGHALAALKHHFFDHDRTLRRILGTGPTH